MYCCSLLGLTEAAVAVAEDVAGDVADDVVVVEDVVENVVDVEVDTLVDGDAWVAGVQWIALDQVEENSDACCY